MILIPLYNTDKCQLLNVSNKKTPFIHTYTIHKSYFQPTSNAKHLGITINNKQSWNTHIDTSLPESKQHTQLPQ